MGYLLPEMGLNFWKLKIFYLIAIAAISEPKK